MVEADFLGPNHFGVVDSKGKNTCQVIYMRHGERADLQTEKELAYDIKCDPPLTETGIA
jgi:hypothetical protein